MGLVERLRWWSAYGATSYSGQQKNRGALRLLGDLPFLLWKNWI